MANMQGAAAFAQTSRQTLLLDSREERQQPLHSRHWSKALLIPTNLGSERSLTKSLVKLSSCLLHQGLKRELHRTRRLKPEDKETRPCSGLPLVLSVELFRWKELISLEIYLSLFQALSALWALTVNLKARLS